MGKRLRRKKRKFLAKRLRRRKRKTLATALVVVAGIEDGGVGVGVEEGESRDWSLLSDLAIFCILTRLSNLADFCSCRCVCRTWRMVSKAAQREFMASQTPLLFREGYCDFHGWSEKGFYKKIISHPDCKRGPVLGISYGYVIHVNSDYWWRPFLVNLFTGTVVHNFPTAYDLPTGFPVNSDYCQAMLLSPPTSTDCILLACSTFYRIFQFCHLGDREWRVCECPWDHSVVGRIICMTLFRGTAYALTSRLKLVTLDVAPRPKFNLLEVKGMEGMEGMVAPRNVGLVECGEELLAVARDFSRRERFAVYRLDLLRLEWVRVKNIGDRALFVDGSGFISSENPARWGGSGNCIYFTRYDPCFPSPPSIYCFPGPPSIEVGVYYLDSNTVKKLSSLDPSLWRTFWVLPSQWY